MVPHFKFPEFPTDWGLQWQWREELKLLEGTKANPPPRPPIKLTQRDQLSGSRDFPLNTLGKKMKEKYIPLAQLVKNTELLYATAKELLLGCFFSSIFPRKYVKNMLNILNPEPNSDQNL